MKYPGTLIAFLTMALGHYFLMEDVYSLSGFFASNSVLILCGGLMLIGGKHEMDKRRSLH